MMAKMLAPAAVLVLWSMIVLLWMAQTRLGGMKKVGSNLGNGKPGGRGVNLEGVLPDEVMWKSHNYAHLMEQPTVFYAVVVILALMGASATDVLLAWAYVGLRIVHSVWQSTVNRIPVRFTLFLVSTICLIALAVRAVMVTLFAA